MGLRCLQTDRRLLDSCRGLLDEIFLRNDTILVDAEPRRIRHLCCFDGELRMQSRLGPRERGYNPPKPGRPSHVHHTHFVANPRLLLEVEMQPGNQTASSYAQPAVGKFLDALEPKRRPALLRGGAG